MRAAGEMARVARRLLLLPLAAWAVMATVGYVPTQSLGGWSAVKAMIVGQAVVVAIVYATLVPAIRGMAGADAQGRLRVGLRAGAIRLGVTLPVAAAIAWYGSLDAVVFLVWVAIAYVVMIKVETLTLIWWNKRLENPP